MDFDYVVSIPTVFEKMEQFKVLKWNKKEALLQDKNGKVKRITPSEFFRYAKNYKEAVRISLKWNIDTLERAKERVLALEKEYDRLKRLFEAVNFVRKEIAKG